ncbi:efflux RND transporter permease subunit [Sediminispirochaeta bajacaliforniensis]|uniref:efflux RND transporter permease subunit n=1 Tax=Sediminispirochaeta bajacaliforniensis TaxID=148 RepID=UPI000382EE13|nr:efflux RND transporter permease subunit [Sediminispirochaeta bajacaliforniensis]
MHIVDLSIKRPVMMLMVIFALILFGGMAYMSMPISLFPNVTVPYITIQTVYAGASPDVIETQLTKKIEDQVASVSQLKSLTSYSMDSVSVIIAEFEISKDENIAVQEVKDKVEVILSDLPDDAERPKISKVDFSSAMPVMNIVLEGDMEPSELYTFGSTTVSDSFAQVSGVSSVDLSGGQKREIRVAFDRSTVFSHMVPLSQVAGILGAASIDLPGGNFQLDDQDIPVRLEGEFNDLDQIRNLDIPTGTGTFKLRQLAEVEDSSEDVRVRTVLLDQKAGTREENAILLSVVKNPSANTVDVVDGVMEKIKEIESLHSGIHLKVVKEDATYVRDSVSGTLMNVYLGIIFTGLVLLFFLHDLRSTLIVVLAMPFSIVSTFLVMKAAGISLNMLSLMGLSSSIGTLVANSVVVLENIFRHKELGHDRLNSASLGSKEVTVAVFASTLTNVAVFVPLGSMSGMMGKILANFAYTIVIATLFSFFVSFTLTPMMASRILPEKAKKELPISKALEAMFRRWEESYGRILGGILKNKGRSALVVFFVIALFGFSMHLGGHLKFENLPQSDGGKIQVDVDLPQGYGLESTASVLTELEGRLSGHPEIESILTTLGSQGSIDQDVSVAQMTVYLVPKAERSHSNAVMASQFANELADIPGVTIRVSPVSETDSSGGSSVVDLYLKGPDLTVLQETAEEVESVMESIEGVSNVALSSKAGKPELIFRPKRKQISEDGISVQQVAISLRAAVDGIVATSYKDAGEEYDILVTMADSEFTDIDDLKNIPISSAAGVYPLSRYANVSFGEGNSKIMRYNRLRTIEITADNLPGYAGGTLVNEIMAAIEQVDLPPGYSIDQGGSTEMLNETVHDLIVVFFIAVLLTYMLLAAILESFVQPLFILSTVPLSMIGIVLICLATGTVLNVVAMLGIIMLVGIVVNNAILILDYYNQLKAKGKSTHDALLEASVVKLKPVLMSNIAIVLGMLPMALGIGGSGAEMRQPMGIVIVGGIISAMFLTLFLLPALEFLASHRSGASSAPLPASTEQRGE